MIVPSYNQGRFIGATLESILSQGHRPLEILVMDGASTDGTLDVIRSFASRPELRWWSEPDSGVAEAVNKGLARARGELAGIQSSDDCYLPGALERVVEAFAGDPELGLLYGDMVTVDETGAELARTRLAPFSPVAFLTKATFIPQPSAFFRTGLAREIGGWDGRYFGADTDMWLRMMFRTKVRKLDAVLGMRRRHEGQRDLRQEEIRESYTRMIRESPDLRRGPWRLRRAARAGALVNALRYGEATSDWQATSLLWRAVAAYPPLLPRVLSGALVPGYGPLRRALGRLRASWKGGR